MSADDLRPPDDEPATPGWVAASPCLGCLLVLFLVVVWVAAHGVCALLHHYRPD